VASIVNIHQQQLQQRTAIGLQGVSKCGRVFFSVAQNHVVMYYTSFSATGFNGTSIKVSLVS